MGIANVQTGVVYSAWGRIYGFIEKSFQNNTMFWRVEKSTKIIKFSYHQFLNTFNAWLPRKPFSISHNELFYWVVPANWNFINARKENCMAFWCVNFDFHFASQCSRALRDVEGQLKHYLHMVLKCGRAIRI